MVDTTIKYGVGHYFGPSHCARTGLQPVLSLFGLVISSGNVAGSVENPPPLVGEMKTNLLILDVQVFCKPLISK
jgi:hypothetical protein